MKSLTIFLAASTCLLAASPPRDTAKTGMDPDRLAKIPVRMKSFVDKGTIAGSVTLVSRHGVISSLEAVGFTDLDHKKPMRTDAIFQIHSMTKPVTATGIMLLMEEGKLALSDPVEKHLTAFKGQMLIDSKEENKIVLKKPSRPITIRDLLTHGSGLLSGGLGNATAGQAAARGASDTLATYIPKLGAVALDFQPGTLWRYSGLAGFDVLSRVVEIASGKAYDQFLRERLFDPLGMKDTGFALTTAIQPRLVTLYRRGQNGLERVPDQSGLSSATYFSGAGGMVSTAEDYAQFGTMLVNGGELNGRRYLSPRTIELMASNHTGEMAGGQMGMSPKGIGFGLGVQVVEDPVAADRRVSKGAWGWAGAYGTNVHIEPAADMVQIVLMQTSTPALQRDFENAVAQAIIK